jgi:thioredoxin 1
MPSNRRGFLLGLALATAGASFARAADRMRYEDHAFASAIASGKPVLVHVTAPWCVECNAQKPIVARIAERPEFKELTIVDVNFDTQKDALRGLKVQQQSTLIVFKNKAEIARLVGDTREEKIEALMKKAL